MKDTTSDTEPRHSKRKSAILCERLTKDYADEYGPGELDDSSQNFQVTDDDVDAQSVSSMEVEEVEVSPIKKGTAWHVRRAKGAFIFKIMHYL